MAGDFFDKIVVPTWLKDWISPRPGSKGVKCTPGVRHKKEGQLS